MKFLACLVTSSTLTAFAPAALGPDILEFRGLCNASAALPVGGGLFVVADDEDKPKTFLRACDQGAPGNAPLKRELPAGDLGLDLAKDEEVDIEGAARLGDRLYWIGSHSASKNAKPRPNRRRLFATKVTVTDGDVRVKVVGSPYKGLVGDLQADPAYAGFDLKAAALIAPKDPGGLSIEGLSATPDGDLLIGFRNPVPGGKALLARLKNPKETTEGKPSTFGPPVLLDLGGQGVRSMEWSADLGRYLIVAGAPGDGGGPSRLLQWSGAVSEPPTEIAVEGLSGLNPEALFVEGRTVTLLSDDGRRIINNVERDCAADGASPSFQAIRVELAPR